MNKSSEKYKSLFDHYGVDNIKIELIEAYPCENKDELNHKENDVKRQYNLMKPVELNQQKNWKS